MYIILSCSRLPAAPRKYNGRPILFRLFPVFSLFIDIVVIFETVQSDHAFYRIRQLYVNTEAAEVEVLGTKPIKKFSFQMTEEEKAETREVNRQQFADAVAMLGRDHYDMLVLDEVLGAIEAGLFDEQVVVDFLKNKPEQLEVVMTGRYPGDALVELADYVSRIDKVKHPFDKGIGARAGIEG